MRRRKLLSLAGVGIGTIVAGCSGSGGDGSGGGGSDGSAGGGGDGSPGGGADGSGGGGGDGSDGSSGETTKSLRFGESYTNPIGNTLTVQGVELRDTMKYTIRDGDKTLTRSALEGEQWAVVTLKVTNDSGKKQYLTPVTEVKVRANGNEYGNTALGSSGGDAYTPEEVEDGGSNSGWILYGVPADLSVGDIEVVHSNEVDGESWTVTWSKS